jgi:hypothetical protein
MSILFIRVRLKTLSGSPQRWRRTRLLCAKFDRICRSRGGAKTISSGLNFTLATNLGDPDLFGEVTGGGSYTDLLSHSVDIDAFDVRFKVIDLVTLI